MRVLVVILGGLDHEFLSRWACENLRQKEWGRVIVDDLWRERDVATQITAQLLTGRSWRENGVKERKRVDYKYSAKLIERVERGPLRNLKKGRGTRHKLYEVFGWSIANQREFMAADVTCPTLFDLVPNSKAVYVPAWNPEPSWALGRNILDPRRFPELGEEGALDLLEKNSHWRRSKFLEALEDDSYQLLIGQFQMIDSVQHLYLDYVDPPDMKKVEACYWRMDEFAGEVKRLAAGKYERTLFISDNGAARKLGYRPTHYNRPFYSVDSELHLENSNMRDFFRFILEWTRAPHPSESQ